MELATYTDKMIIQVLGDRPAIQTFSSHVVAKIPQCYCIVDPRGDPGHKSGDPRNLGDDVGHTSRCT